MYEKEKRLLPEFPRTRHLAIEPNATSDDTIASAEETAEFLANCSRRGGFVVEEKIDGSNCGMRLHEGRALIRNRTHIMNKAYCGKDTPAKKQFASVFTWFYDNVDKFTKLEKLLGFTPSVFGEWTVATHVLPYSNLPEWFIPFDIYSANEDAFLEPHICRQALWEAGFALTPWIAEFPAGTPAYPMELMVFRDGTAAWQPGARREGIYLRGGDPISGHLTHRFKMVAPWFKSDPGWAKATMVKNKKQKGFPLSQT